VNLWPLTHFDERGAAVMWPLADFDARGFALRPLVANDGSRWEVLFPWASFDTNSGTGWAVPFYVFEKNAGLFPLANFGAFSWIGPVWWNRARGAAVTSGGVFPVVWFGDTICVGPVWWTSREGNFGVFPLFGVASLKHIGPVWWARDDDGTARAGLFPLFYWGDEGRELGALPFYWQDIGPAGRTYNALLGFVHNEETADSHSRWVAPFYYDRERPGASDTLLFPFFWKRVRGEDAQVFTLLGSRSIDADSRSLNIYPFWWSNESEESTWRMLFPLFYFEEEGEERTLLTPLGGYGWNASGPSRFVNVLGPLYHSSRSADGREERTAVLWPLFERRRDGEVTTTRAAPFLSVTERPGDTEAWYALGLGHARDSADVRSHRLWPLYAVSEGTRSPRAMYSLTLYGSESRGEGTSRWLFPLFKSSSSPGAFELSLALGIGAYESRGEDDSWHLWPLVSHHEGPDAGFGHWTTLFGSAESEGYEEWHVGSPLLWCRETFDYPSRREEQQHWLTLFFHESEEARGLLVPRGNEPSAENRVAREEHGFLFGLFSSENARFRVWRDGAVTADESSVLSAFSTRYDALLGFERAPDDARAILERHGFAPADASAAALTDALVRFTATSTREVAFSEHQLWPLFGYERRDDALKWNGPLWLVYGEERADYSLFSFLFYGYRSETKGAETRRDIFPFITWDSAPDETRVSFLWRLFRYERRGDRSGGYAFFVPWGDPGD